MAHLHILVTDEQKRRLTLRAKRRGLSLCDEIRLMIEETCKAETPMPEAPTAA